MVKNLPAMQETWLWSLGREDPLQKGLATHSSILAWRIPWTEEPGGLLSVGSQRIGRDWVTHTHTRTCTYTHTHTPTVLKFLQTRCPDELVLLGSEPCVILTLAREMSWVPSPPPSPCRVCLLFKMLWLLSSSGSIRMSSNLADLFKL